MDYRKVCSECNIPSDEFNTNVFGDVICGECGVQSHCFCDDCGEYVPTSHCSLEDSVLDVDGMEIEESKVICNVCDENSDEPSQDPRGDYVKIKASDLNSICEIAKSLMKFANGDSVIESRAYNILTKAQQPLQERDPQNLN